MKIVVLDGFTVNPGDNSWDAIESLGELTVHARTRDSLTIERASDADVIVTNKVVLSEAILSQLPRLKFVAVSATGFDVVDIAFARSQGIAVSNVPVYSTDSVAQFVMAAVLSFIHRPFEHHLSILDGEWQRKGDFSYWLSPLTELAGKTFGVYGWGRIGQATGRLAAAFGMRVIVSSRTRKQPLDSAGFQFVEKDELFASSDFLSLHVPATSETIGSINRRVLMLMQPHAVLVNTARGSLIVESDLAEVLNCDRLAGAILDVVSQEPIQVDNPLLSAKNCRLTPHIAWATLESRKRLMRTTASNIEAFLSGQPINLVN